MANKRKGVTFENSLRVYFYFRDALNDQKRNRKVLADSNYSYQMKAEDALKEIPSYKACDIEKFYNAKKQVEEGVLRPKHLELYLGGENIYDIEKLDKWVCEYISDKGWTMCLSNIRQRKHAVTAPKQRQIKINSWTLSRLKDHSKAQGFKTLDEYLSSLMDKEDRNRE